ncbi:hypothetical protein LCGC14_0948510 [marine sediment metagenome]|uniref:Terminase large subunit gp17-like C-terminal domain-containing protein n=1 Tax=marine sediment metagenome TaxID=412755 RepID=A0A0F9NI31_9ZZZZ
MIIHEVTEKNFEEEREKGESLVQAKFDRWDKLGKLRNSIPKEEWKAKAAYLMRDPTIWAYSILRYKGVPIKPYYFQDLILNDKHRFVHVSAANQIGKTWALQIKALHHALSVDYGSVMLISRSEDQAKRILDNIKWMMREARIKLLEEFCDEVANRFELHLQSPRKGVSTINVFPPTTKILGYPATLVGLDETGFWEKDSNLDPIEYYQQCIEPRTNATKNWKHPFLTMGQIVSITNPNGQDGLAWWLYNRDKYNQYVYNWLANQNNTLEEYKQAENELPPIRFASIYAAQYVITSGGFITLDQYNRFKAYNGELVVQPGFTLYLGGDVAGESPKTKNTDSSVLYAVIQVKNKYFPQNPRLRVVHRKSFKPGTPREDFYNEIDMLKKLPNVHIAKFAYDKPGVGDSVQRDLIGRGILSESQIEPLTYSLPSKSEVYLNFQQLFHQDMIEGCDIPELQEQLLALKVEQPTGSIHIKVHHKTEGIKDDEPDALANACFVARGNNNYLESSFVQAKVIIPKDADESLAKGIKANQDFESYLRKHASSGQSYF